MLLSHLQVVEQPSCQVWPWMYGTPLYTQKATSTMQTLSYRSLWLARVKIYRISNEWIHINDGKCFVKLLTVVACSFTEWFDGWGIEKRNFWIFWQWPWWSLTWWFGGWGCWLSRGRGCGLTTHSHLTAVVAGVSLQGTSRRQTRNCWASVRSKLSIRICMNYSNFYKFFRILGPKVLFIFM